MASSAATIHVVSPEAFDRSASSPGFSRPAAIAPELGVQSAIWAGLFEVDPGAHTTIHHHGAQETVAYVLSGECEVRWGEQGEHAAIVRAGDFIHIPAFLPHTEVNPSATEPFRWVIVRSTPTTIVENLPDDAWSA
jgi:uncharacterized RmlC-like cupin family protein